MQDRSVYAFALQKKETIQRFRMMKPACSMRTFLQRKRCAPVYRLVR